MSKKLSIVTINYNNLPGLKKTVESVLSQTCRDFEYIIMDGGSTDGSAEYLQERSGEFDYWVSERDAGIYNAMNKGLYKSSGEFLYFLNSGDLLFSKDVIAKANSIITEGGIYFFDFVIDYANGKNELIKNTEPLTLCSILGRERHFCHQAIIMSKDAILKAGGQFDESLKFISDWKMIAISIIKNESKVFFSSIVISVYDGTGVSMSKANNQLLHAEHDRVLKSSFPLYYNDVSRLNKMHVSFSELFNSKMIKLFFRVRKFILGIVPH